VFRNAHQKANVCCELLASVNLEHLWGHDDQPSPEAVALIDAIQSQPAADSPLSPGATLLFRLTWDLWSGRGRVSFKDLISTLDSASLDAVGSLLAALAEDEDAIDTWLFNSKIARLTAVERRLSSSR
jgi:hypothetical protein